MPNDQHPIPARGPPKSIHPAVWIGGGIAGLALMLCLCTGAGVGVYAWSRAGKKADGEKAEKAKDGKKAPTPIVMADLIDNPANYKGRTITLHATVDDLIFPEKGDSLRHHIGRDVKFNCTRRNDKGIMDRLDIVIFLPADLSVPNVGYLDRVVVVFTCNEGNLRSGNVAKSIARP